MCRPAHFTLLYTPGNVDFRDIILHKKHPIQLFIDRPHITGNNLQKICNILIKTQSPVQTMSHQSKQTALFFGNQSPCSFDLTEGTSDKTVPHRRSHSWLCWKRNPFTTCPTARCRLRWLDVSSTNLRTAFVLSRPRCTIAARKRVLALRSVRCRFLT